MIKKILKIIEFMLTVTLILLIAIGLYCIATLDFAAFIFDMFLIVALIFVKFLL